MDCWDVGYWGCGILRVCEMFGMWNVGNVGYLGYVTFEMWDVCHMRCLARVINEVIWRTLYESHGK